MQGKDTTTIRPGSKINAGGVDRSTGPPPSPARALYGVLALPSQAPHYNKSVLDAHTHTRCDGHASGFPKDHAALQDEEADCPDAFSMMAFPLYPRPFFTKKLKNVSEKFKEQFRDFA